MAFASSILRPRLSSWGRLSEKHSSGTPEEKVSFYAQARLLLQSAAKEKRAEIRRHSASATSTAKCSAPWNLTPAYFQGTISGIHACRHLRPGAREPRGGQQLMKRAVGSAAGGHNILMFGPI